jgi:hypothetical protein
MMDKVQKHNSFNTNTPLSESYRNYLSKLDICYCVVPAFIGMAEENNEDTQFKWLVSRLICEPVCAELRLDASLLNT